MPFMKDRRTGYVLHIHNSNAPITEHPTLDHAIKHASFVAAQEGKTNAVGATINRPDGQSETHNVHPMNESAVAAHKDAVKTGAYRLKTL
jgi:hypothetical protein